MTDKVSRETRSRMMSAVRSSNTNLERRLASRLWKDGFRFRRNVRNLYGKPDLAVKKYKAVVFIDSCFWHGCPLHFKPPQSNIQFWSSKIQQNVARDEIVTKHYVDARWRILRIWEHDIDEDFERVVSKVEAFLRNAINATEQIS